jgi:ribosomal protein L21E
VKYVETILVDGEPVLIEVEEQGIDSKVGSGTEQLGVKETIEQAKDTFDNALLYVRRFAKGTVRRIRKFDQDIAPSTFELEFAVKFSGKTGVITEIGGEAHLVVRLIYNHDEEKK